MSRKPGFTRGAPQIAADVPGLSAFVSVARAGTVGQAAEWLGRTQPSISARLAGLESAWGTRLFRRVARGMELTPEGSRLLPIAEAALRELEELDRTAGLPVAGSGELRIGAGDALGRERLPAVLSELIAEHPGIEVYLREGAGPALLEALRDGEIDVALVVWEDDGSAEGLDLQPWLESPVELLVPADRGGGKGPVPIRKLAGERIVSLHRGSRFRGHLEQAFATAGMTFRPAVEVGNLSLVRRFVAAGLGVAPIPSIAFAKKDDVPVARRGLRGIDPLRYARAIRAGAPLSRPTRELLDRLRR